MTKFNYYWPKKSLKMNKKELFLNDFLTKSDRFELKNEINFDIKTEKKTQINIENYTKDPLSNPSSHNMNEEPLSNSYQCNINHLENTDTSSSLFKDNKDEFEKNQKEPLSKLNQQNNNEFEKNIADNQNSISNPYQQNTELEKNTSDKKEKLAKLRKKKMEDTSIIFANQGNNFVFEDGNPNADIMFIGEAPGEEEDRQTLPFVGKSGQLLRHFLKEAKINDFYITNIVSWRPPNNRTPTSDEILSMQSYIFEHIKIVNPKIIVAVGTTSIKALNIFETITKAQGRIFESEIGRIYPIYHPSYALRVSSKKKELWISLLKLKSIL